MGAGWEDCGVGGYAHVVVHETEVSWTISPAASPQDEKHPRRVRKPCPAIMVWLDPFSVQIRTTVLLIGYARVLTRGQTLDMRRDDLRAEGCERVWR